MHAAVAGFSQGQGYLFKCPICGVILEPLSSCCTVCGQHIESTLGVGYMPKVSVDLHGVVLDMCSALRDYFAEHGLSFDPEKVTDYDFDCDTGVPQAEVFTALGDPRLYDFVKPYPGALDALKLLQSRCACHVYSSTVDNETIMAKTNSFIYDVGLFGACISGRKPVIYDSAVLFDDNVAVHRQWYEAGYRGVQYIIDRPYNQPKREEPMWSKVVRVPSFGAGVLDFFKRVGWLL